jgi:hypothetical protein
MVMNDGILEKISVTAVNGTDGREALSKWWVAVLVKIRSEKAVAKKLLNLEIENYVPTQWEVHQWSDRRKKVERVVIPMVVFVRTDAVTGSVSSPIPSSTSSCPFPARILRSSSPTIRWTA